MAWTCNEHEMHWKENETGNDKGHEEHEHATKIKWNGREKNEKYENENGIDMGWKENEQWTRQVQRKWPWNEHENESANGQEMERIWNWKSHETRKNNKKNQSENETGMNMKSKWKW